MNKGKTPQKQYPAKAIKQEPPRAKKPCNKKESPHGARLIPLAEEPTRDWAAKMLAGGAWPLVDAEAQREIGRRRPPKALVERANQIADILEREFPNARCALHYSTPLELLVATILSAQCTDVRVNQITPELFQIYRSPEDFAASPDGELEEAIRSAGFFNNKARSIRACCRELLDRHKGEVPAGMEELSALSGVGRKTASVIRANAFGLPGITVDTHIIRLSGRLSLTDSGDPVQIEFDLGSLLAPGRWSQFSHALILHGRKTCQARRPDCAACPLQSLCPSAGKFDL